MTRKELLLVLVKGGLLVGLAAFTAVYIRGLLAPRLDSGDVVDVSGMVPGSARLEGWGGKPVWVVNRSPEQLRRLDTLTAYVRAPGEAGNPALDNLRRSLDPAFGVYLAQTARTGVLVQYTRDRPPGLASGVPWFGGFVDPASGAAFDVAGRRYRATSGEPLQVPPHHFVGPAIISLGIW